MSFLLELKLRNEPLFWFGTSTLILAAICAVLIYTSTLQVLGISAYIKPLKFALSTTFFVWTMGWICVYLPTWNPSLFSWTTIVMLGFEVVYIFWKASQGELSHFNVSTKFHSVMYSCMAAAASIVTFYTAYIAFLFFTQPNCGLETHYLWALRLGLIIFVIFSFEGFVMGARMSHTIGAPDGGEGIPLLNWSRTFGDPRVAHFIGMHALQVLPLLSYYLLKSTKLTIFIAVLYALLAAYTLMQALQAKPFFPK